MKFKKNTILYLTVLTVLLMGLLGMSSCKRSAPQDPTMQGPAGFRVILSGTANPSTLYVPENQPAVSSVITVTALNNDGTPVANSKVVFKVEKWGYLDNSQISDIRTTNSSGVATINYYIPARQNVGGDGYDYVEVTLVDDGRLDTASSTFSHVRDRIPIRIIPYAKSAFRIHGHIMTPSGNGIGEIPVSLVSGDESGSVHTVTRPSGSYEFYVYSGWYGTITPTSSNYTFTPAEYTFVETYPVLSNLEGMDFIGSMSAGNLLAVTPAQWSPTADASSYSFNVVNKSGDSSISYIILSSTEWLSVSPSSGATPGSFTASTTLNDTVAARSASITISSVDTQTSEATVAVSQAVGSTAPATLAVSPTTYNAPSAGDSDVTIGVANSANDDAINYIVSTNVSWITLSAGSGTTGGTSSSFTIDISANTDADSRTGTITVTAQGSDVSGSPQTVTVTQDGTSTGALDLVVSQDRFVIPSTQTGALDTITVSTNYASDVFWYVENSDSWISVTPMSGSTASGSNTLVISVQTTNTTGSDRTGTVYVREVHDSTYTTIEIVQKAN